MRKNERFITLVPTLLASSQSKMYPNMPEFCFSYFHNQQLIRSIIIRHWSWIAVDSTVSQNRDLDICNKTKASATNVL